MEHLLAGRTRFERPIMCAGNASAEGPKVARTAARLAGRTGSPLVLLRVSRRHPDWRWLDGLLHPDGQAFDPEHGRKLLEERAAEVPLSASLEVTSGTPAEEILVAAEEMESAPLVMGRPRAESLPRLAR
jgi:nucleotide-binding universal stress UspA family protein